MLVVMNESASNVAPSRELLLANHAFPGEYIVKAFGPKTDDFRDAVHASAAQVVGAARVQIAERSSRHGRRVCVTLTIAAETVDDVIRVYAQICRVPELMMIL
jgi:putative lipoic acid-binding regulatory protein